MNLSVEISLYPLQDDYIPVIDAFLADINKTSGIEIRTSNMSTRLFGDYDTIMLCVAAAIKRSMQQYGKVVFVTKFLQGDARRLEKYD